MLRSESDESVSGTERGHPEQIRRMVNARDRGGASAIRPAGSRSLGVT
jgi:hypothetical protein